MHSDNEHKYKHFGLTEQMRRAVHLWVVSYASLGPPGNVLSNGVFLLPGSLSIAAY